MTEDECEDECEGECEGEGESMFTGDNERTKGRENNNNFDKNASSTLTPGYVVRATEPQVRSTSSALA